MKDRIKQIMESQHMTQQVFADFIGMSPASLSSIFNDRTRPTLNIVEAIKKKIPDISTDWLMFGVGTMYQSAAEPASAPQSGAREVHESMLDFDVAPAPTPSGGSPAVHSVNGVKMTRAELFRDDAKNIDKPARRVTEIRVYYDDQTWEGFVPSKK